MMSESAIPSACIFRTSFKPNADAPEAEKRISSRPMMAESRMRFMFGLPFARMRRVPDRAATVDLHGPHLHVSEQPLPSKDTTPRTPVAHCDSQRAGRRALNNGRTFTSCCREGENFLRLIGTTSLGEDGAHQDPRAHLFFRNGECHGRTSRPPKDTIQQAPSSLR